MKKSKICQSKHIILLFVRNKGDFYGPTSFFLKAKEARNNQCCRVIYIGKEGDSHTNETRKTPLCSHATFFFIISSKISTYLKFIIGKTTSNRNPTVASAKSLIQLILVLIHCVVGVV